MNYPNPAPGTSGSDKAPALNGVNGASTAVPNWPERCRQCLAQNELDPNTALYCDPDIDCPYYPFK